MAVDLSRVGLEGIETGQRTLNSIAAREASAVETQAAQFKLQEQQREAEFDKLAGLALGATLRGEASYDPSFSQRDQETMGNSRSGTFDVLARMAAQSGFAGKAADLLKTASEIEKREQDILDGQATRSKNWLDAYAKTAETVGRYIGNAQNESEWQYALKQIEGMPEIVNMLGEENFAQLKQLGYDPDVVSYISEQAMTQYQRAQLQATAQYREHTLNQGERRLRLAERQTIVAEERAAEAIRQGRLKAEGAKDGKSAEAPNKTTLDAVQAQLANELFGGAIPAAANTAVKAGVVSIASRAQAMLRADKSLTFDEAVSRALMESQAAGEWDVFTEGGFLGFGEKETASFQPKGTNRQNAIQAPQDPSQLISGRYYKRADGTTWKFTGSGFEPAN